MEKNLKVSELKQLCKEKGIQGYSKKKKEELLAMLNNTVATAARTHHIQKTDPENSLALFIPYKSELIEIRRTEDWWVNITEISKKLGKDFKYWKKDNKHTIATFEQMANQAVLYETGGQYSQTFVDIRLAIAVLTSYNKQFAFHVFSVYVEHMKNILEEHKKEIDEKDQALLVLEKDFTLLRNKHERMKKKRVHPSLERGPVIYIVDNPQKGLEKQYKFGISTDVNKTLQTYRRKDPLTKVCFLAYVPEKSLKPIEGFLIDKWEPFLVSSNHEVVSNTTICKLIADLKAVIELLGAPVEYATQDAIDTFNRSVLLEITDATIFFTP